MVLQTFKYFEASERYRHKYNDKLSFNVGAVQRLSEPYGYDPLKNGNYQMEIYIIHF